MLNDFLKNPFNENIIGDFDSHLFPSLKLNISSLMILTETETDEETKIKRAQLNETKVAQPAILLHSILNFYKFFNENTEKIQTNSLRIDSVFGPSLGEIIALVAAESIGLNEAGVLLYNRGKFMQESCPIGTGSMLNVIGDVTKSIEVFKKFKEEVNLKSKEKSLINISSINSKRLLVISGKKDLVDSCSVFLKKNSIATRKLPVSAAFHSALMNEGQEMFKKHLEEADYEFRIPRFKVLSTIQPNDNQDTNKNVLIYCKRYGGIEFDKIVKKMLTDQFTHPVNLIECVKYNSSSDAVIYDMVKRKISYFEEYL